MTIKWYALILRMGRLKQLRKIKNRNKIISIKMTYKMKLSYKNLKINKLKIEI